VSNRPAQERLRSGAAAVLAGVRRQLGAPFAATAGSVLLFWASLTPSLLPRSPVYQGVVTAVAALVGYGLGALLGWIVRTCGGRLVGRTRRTSWLVVGGGALVGTVVMLTAYLRWENWLRDAVGIDRIGVGSLLRMLLVGATVFVVGLVVARGLKATGRVVGRFVGRFLPARAATVVGGLVVALVVYLLVTGVATDRVLGSLDATFMAVNDEFSTDVPAPSNRFVSGGPRSAVGWDDLGRQGRVFIANVPTRAQVASFSGRRARAPVRAYVGVGTDGDVDLGQEAARAVTELERLGGFDRAVLNVVTGTGTGWVNENSAQSLEYMWDGDTATVSIQYSYLPSLLSFLVDGNRAEVAGRLLFDEVYAHWSGLPPTSRPKLVVSGESLGSYGAEAAFSGAQDLASRTDGALFVGPTNNNPLWSRFTAERDSGTPEVLPTYGGGATVRFADRPSDLTTAGTWHGSRVGYLQHANDPVTWWDWSLALRKPDWLSEPRGRDVSPSIRWIPLITMLQLGADQLVANSAPSGQGHQFGTAPAYAWATILPPPGWTTSDTTRLAARIAQRVAPIR
jgi:uncharacterized membrane protein